ncbi:MAG TPA: thioredoxin family protein [Anaerolineae bacterium]|nr:thioredoxin family protein [Anaerolineae bacterium]
MNEILRYEVLSTPVLVINEQVVAVGKVLRTEEILAHLRAAMT